MLAPVQSALSQSICDKEQEVYFSCYTKHEKIIAICYTPNSPRSFYFQYRFGRPGKIELIYPREDRKNIDDIGIYGRTAGPVNEVHMGFRIGKYHYRLHNRIEEVEGRNQNSNIAIKGHHYQTTRAGVTVWREGRGGKDLLCLIDQRFVQMPSHRPKN